MRQAPSGTYLGEHGFSVIRPKDDIRYKATGEYRSPRKGEYYLSGAEIQAYKALNDLDGMQYWIARPVQMVQCACCKGLGKTVGA